MKCKEYEAPRLGIWLLAQEDVLADSKDDYELNVDWIDNGDL